jgi:hypothetical protein
MAERRPARVAAPALALVAALLAAACGGDDGGGTAGGGEGDGGRAAVEPSPFTVEVPDGFRPVMAGRGETPPDWGSDSFGTHEPFTVLAPPGEGPDSPEAVLVSVTGFEGYEGGLSQASAGYGSSEPFDLDGAEAIFTPAGGDDGNGGRQWADLVVVRGDDLAVRVTAPSATQDELAAIAERVEPAADHLVAPAVPEPPEGLEVVGSVDADVIVSLTPYVEEFTDRGPGAETALGAGWLQAPPAEATGTGGGPEVVTVQPGATPLPPEAAAPEVRSELAVLTLPGGSADLEAVGGLARAIAWVGVTTTEVDVAGRPGVVVEMAYDSGPSLSRVLLTEAPWGDLLMVAATGTADGAPDAAALTAVAASAREATAEEWEAFTIEATGGPGLAPDPGAQELARGTAGDVEWLLQAVGGLPDDCLKLSTRERACASGGMRGGPGFVAYPMEGQAEADGFPPFAIVSLAGVDAAASLRVTTPAGTAEADLHPVGDGGPLAAVVVVDAPGVPVCADTPEAPESVPTMRVEVLDAGGASLGCLDMNGEVRPGR